MADGGGRVPVSCGLSVLYLLCTIFLGLHYGPALGLGRSLGAAAFMAGYLAVLAVIVAAQVAINRRTRRFSGKDKGSGGDSGV